jgi:beta-galactosidase
VASWTWDLADGARAEVEVYSDADEVELILNGRPLGRAAAGAAREFRASFDVPYEPGELVALAYRDGIASERTALVTASDRLLVASADRSSIRADSGDLAYISIEFRDRHDVLNSSKDATVHVTVDGPGDLVALGSARPATEQRFDSTSCTTFDGRALAIVRPTGEGRITVTVRSEGESDAHAVITVGES